MHFTAPWEKALRCMTTALVIFFIVEVVVLLILFHFTVPDKIAATGISLLLVAINGGIVLFSYLLAPKGFWLDDERVTVERPLFPIKIEFKKITGVRAIPKEALTRAARVMGNGGLFGFYGVFRNKELGSFRLYATDRSKGILIEADKKYILTPDRPEDFLALLEARLKSSW